MAQHLHQGAVKLIAVDVGNTSTAVGLWSGGRVSRVSHVDGSVEAACAAIGKLASAGGIDTIAYASVEGYFANSDSLFQKLKHHFSFLLL